MLDNQTLEFFKYSTSTFWVFVGVYAITYLILYFGMNGILQIFAKFFQLITILFRGYNNKETNKVSKESKSDKIDSKIFTEEDMIAACYYGVTLKLATENSSAEKFSSDKIESMIKKYIRDLRLIINLSK